MGNYAVVNEQREVVNVIAYDGVSEYDHGEGLSLIESAVAEIGGKFIGDKYVHLSPYDSWVLNADFEWEAPVPNPRDGKAYYWDEESVQWKLIPAKQ